MKIGPADKLSPEASEAMRERAEVGLSMMSAKGFELRPIKLNGVVYIAIAITDDGPDGMEGAVPVAIFLNEDQTDIEIIAWDDEELVNTGQSRVSAEDIINNTLPPHIKLVVN